MSLVIGVDPGGTTGLPAWEKSIGARLEHSVAAHCGLKIYSHHTIEVLNTKKAPPRELQGGAFHSFSYHSARERTR